MILVVGRVRCPAEKRDALVALMEKMQDESRREKGCIRYGFFAAVEDEFGVPVGDADEGYLESPGSVMTGYEG